MLICKWNNQKTIKFYSNNVQVIIDSNKQTISSKDQLILEYGFVLKYHQMIN